MKRTLSAIAILIGLIAVLQWEPGPTTDSPLDAIAPQRASLTVPLPTRRLTAEKHWMGNSPEEVAHRFIESNRERWGIQSHHELRAEILENPLGTLVRYKVFQGDYELLGMEIQMRVTRNLEVKNVEMQYRPVAEADLNQPVLNSEQIEESIENRFEKVSEAVTPVLYLPRGQDTVPVPAFAMTVRRRVGDPISVQAIFRASDGQVLDLTVPRSEF